MIIPKAIRTKWARLKQPGDVAEIAKKLEVSTQTVSRAFSGKNCTLETFNAMVDFYNVREEAINDLIKKAS